MAASNRISVANLDTRAMTHPYSPVPLKTIDHSPHEPLISQPLSASQSQLYCRYRSRVCTNLRACKRNGALHRYCEMHRVRANTNQTIWAQRRMQAFDNGVIPTLTTTTTHLAASTPVPANVVSFEANSDVWPPPTVSSATERDLAGGWSGTNDEPLPVFSATDSDCELLWEALGLEHTDNDDDERDAWR